MTRLRTVTGLVVCALLGWAAPARPDAVVDWNEIASQAIAAAAAAGRPGPATVLDFAVVQVAVYDAVQAIEGRYKPYHVRIPHAQGSSAAAAARAAHDVLVNRFPSQMATLDTTYHTYLSSHGLAEDDPGVTVGAQVAAHIVALRASDGSFPATFPAFTGGTDPGQWRPTTSYLPGPPPSGAAMAAPWLGSVTPFVLRRSDQLRPPPPPPLASRRYARDYEEVRDLGAFTGGTRTPAQTDLAYFYSGNIVVQFNRLVRSLATAHVTHIADTARLFALTTAATADAIISSWDSKLHFAFWRPVTAIQEGDNDGNARTEGDPDWTPLINTPNYPDYTSGANNAAGATTRALELFFGTDAIACSVTTDVGAATTKTRNYASFSAVADDMVDARILLGIHFRFADTVARRQGERAAGWAFRYAFRPVRSTDPGGRDGAPDDGIQDHDAR